MNCAVIVDNRLTNEELDATVERHIKYLPDWKVICYRPENIKSGHDYNRILTSEDFWQMLVEFDRVLIFQHDSGILREGVDEFLEWDYVGAPWLPSAPWAHPKRLGGNGGFSLRCPKKALSLIRHKNYDPSYANEDVFYVHHLHEVQGRVAPYEVCRRFSTETEFQLGTFGYHAIDKHFTDKQIEEVFSQYGANDLPRKKRSSL